MRLAGLQPGDVVWARKNGTSFYARVLDPHATFMGAEYVEVEPLTKGVTYRLLRARQIERKVGDRFAAPMCVVDAINAGGAR